MSLPEFDLGILGIKFSRPELSALGAGLLGSLIYLKFLGPMPWYERLTLLACGVATTYYLTPWTTQQFDVANYRDMVAFLVGVFGMAILWAILGVLTAVRANPFALLRMLIERVRP